MINPKPNTARTKPQDLQPKNSRAVISNYIVSKLRRVATVEPSATCGKTVQRFEIIDSEELARRLTVPGSWVREHTRSRSADPIPHVRLGKYVRFLWGSPELEQWLKRRIVSSSNKVEGRALGKESV